MLRFTTAVAVLAGRMPWDKLVCAMLALGLVGGTAPPAHAQGAPQPPAPVASRSLEELLRRFETATTPADVVVVVDTSASMSGPKFAAVRQSLAALTEAVTPGDYLAVIGFDREARYLIPPHRVAAQPGALQRAITTLAEPSAVPASGDWGASDLGRGIEKALDELLRPGASPVQFLFLLSDGFHQPPRDTQYPPGDPSMWRTLSLRAQEATRGNGVEVDWLWFEAGASAEPLRQVFPNSMPLTLNPEEMRSYFARLKDEIRIRKLRLQVRRELADGGVTLHPAAARASLRYGGTCAVPITIASRFSRLGLAVTLQSPGLQQGRHASFRLTPARTAVALEPAQQGELGTLQVHHRSPGLVGFVLSELGVELPDIHQEVRVPVQVTVHPQAGLRRLDPEMAVTLPVELKLDLVATVVPVWPVWLSYAGLLLLGLVAILVRLVQRGDLRVPSPRLGGGVGLRGPWSRDREE
ncbi:MAG TPA: vWA domain-containing protein [Armatimonadota bacterium]|nr:vWA domain-containing protein [Armatimonadota bacterium]